MKKFLIVVVVLVVLGVVFVGSGMVLSSNLLSGG